MTRRHHPARPATKGPRVRSTLVLLSFLTSAATALALVPAVPATATDDGGAGPDRVTTALPPVQRSAPVALPPQASPRATLAVPDRVLDGEARTADPSATVALRDLTITTTQAAVDVNRALGAGAMTITAFEDISVTGNSLGFRITDSGHSRQEPPAPDVHTPQA